MPPAIANLLNRFGLSRDLALGFGVIAIIAMLILPMPAWMLDLGLALSITISVMIFNSRRWASSRNSLKSSSVPYWLFTAR